MMFGRKKPGAVRKAIAKQVRAFAAAKTDRILEGWTNGDMGFTSAEISAYLSTIRSRSREASKDDENMKRYLRLFKINVVGDTGFRLKSLARDGNPDGERTLDRKAARVIEYHWRRFCTHRDSNGNTYFDETGKKTEAQMDRLNVNSWARDGEYMMLIVRGADNPYGISFRALRPDWLDEKMNSDDTGNNTFIHCGVEKDSRTRKNVAYWFFTPSNSAYAVNTRHGPRVRIPAADIIHGFSQEDEEQPRGIPLAHAVLRKMKMLYEYDVAELTAAREEACSIGTYYAPLGEEDEVVDLCDEQHSGLADTLTAGKEAGQNEILPKGYKREIHTPQHPNRNAFAYKRSLKRDLATGLNLEYANFANDWEGVTFSSVRQGTISERDSWKVDQADYIDDCKCIQFLAWLESFLSLSISGSLPPQKFDKFASHAFIGRRWSWVDPLKDMKAAEMAVAKKWKTNEKVASEIGEDYHENVEAMKDEEQPQSNEGAPNGKA